MCFGVLGCGEVGWRAQLHNWPREEYRSVSEDGWQAGASPGPGQDAGFIPQSTTVNSHKVFRPRPRHCRLLLGQHRKTEKMSTTSIGTEAVLCIV